MLFCEKKLIMEQFLIAGKGYTMKLSKLISIC